MPYQVVQIPLELLQDSFYFIKDYAKALADISDGRTVVTQMYQAIAAGQHELYIAFNEKGVAEAFFTLRKETHGTKTGLIIYWLAGKPGTMKNWILAVRGKMEQRAYETGVDFVRFETPRKGWESVVSSLGMEPTGTIFEIKVPPRDGKQQPESLVTGRNDNNS